MPTTQITLRAMLFLSNLVIVISEQDWKYRWRTKYDFTFLKEPECSVHTFARDMDKFDAANKLCYRSFN